MAGFDLKFMPEFDGSTPIVVKVEKVEIICCLIRVKGVKHIILL